MLNTQRTNRNPLRAIGWLGAVVLLLIGAWLAILLPLFAMVFSQIGPGGIVLIAGIGVIVILRRYRTA